GVMIAVALIPPAATVGIGIAWADPWVSLPAAVLTLVNVLSINVVSLAVLWYRGYRPTQWFREDTARRTTIRRIGALVLAIAVLSVFLGGITLNSVDRARTEDAIRADANAVLQDRPNATLLEVQIDRTSDPIFQKPSRVIVTVGIPPGSTEPNLAAALDSRFERTTGTTIRTQVRYVTIESA
ncbi:MAG: DUF389 domain-containing protein, partial [Halapricum sp.]